MFGYEQLLGETRFAFQQLMDCVSYKAGHHFGIVVLIAVGLILLWKMLGPNVRSA
jgi:hypothetical protein